jgi:hypothetical protein
MVLVLFSSTPIDFPKIASTAWTNERPCAYVGNRRVIQMKLATSNITTHMASKGRVILFLTPCSHPGEEETRVPSTSKVIRVENEETA